MSTLLEMSSAIGDLGLLLVAAVGMWFAWRRVRAADRQAEASFRQAELSRREHVAALFNRSVGQLGDEKIEVRLGAIYTLRQIGTDFPDLAVPVFELLSAYMRENAVEYGDEEPPVDVREIMETLRRRLELSDG